jgi:hypothetical protein
LTPPTPQAKNIIVAQRNWRLIFSVTAFSFIVLIALLLVAFGYFAAASHAIGHFAPIGRPTNVKHK